MNKVIIKFEYHILYFLLIGRSPFESSDCEKLKINNKIGFIEFKHQYWEHISPEAKEVGAFSSACRAVSGRREEGAPTCGLIWLKF